MPSLLAAFGRSRPFLVVASATRPLRRRVELTLLYRFDLRAAVPDVRADVAVEMMLATARDVDEAALLTGADRRQTFRDRLADGMACYVARVDGRVVAYNWTWFRSAREGMDAIDIGAGEIYTHDAFTVPHLRGRKIHTETLAYMLRAAKEQGYRDAFTMVSALNPWSRKTLVRLGWRRSGQVLRVKVGDGFRLFRLSGSVRPLSPQRQMRRVGEPELAPSPALR
jgi:GNAT superfamily N-acetyltransferase